MAVVTQYSSGSAGSGSSMISCQRPKRISTCSRIGTKPSSQSAIGGTSTAQQLLAGASRPARRRPRAPARLPEEHRAVDLEVVVVAAVERVEVHRPLAREELAVGLDRRARCQVDHVAVVPAEHVDVRRHVLQVPGVRAPGRAAGPPPAAPAPGAGDISIRWMYMCSRPGCGSAGVASARSSTAIASSVSAPCGGLAACAGPTAARASGSSAPRRTARRRRDRRRSRP